MRSYRLDAGAGLDGLRLELSERPVPGPGEVLVAVRAASLGYREVMILEDRYVLPVRDGGIPLAEGAGVVAATGPGVTGPRVGARVVAAPFPRWQDGPFSLDVVDQIGGSLDGMLAEHVVLPATALVEVPDELSDVEAATLPVAGLTAWNALTGGRGTRPGDTVLTLGTGGVSLFAVQLAGAMGARVVATTGNDARAGLLRDLGADVVLNHRDDPDWPRAVREATGGRGADVVVEVGGALGSSMAAVALGGEIAVVGFLGGPAAGIDPYAVFTTGATLRPVAVGSRAQLAAFVDAVRTHRIRPVLDDRVFAFDDAPAAFVHYLGGTARGKVVITIATDNGRN